MRQRISEAREPQSCELRFLKQDGKQFWAHLNALAVPDQNDATVLRVVMTAITARKLAELALRDSNAYLESLIKTISSVIAQGVDITGRNRARSFFTSQSVTFKARSMSANAFVALR